MLPHVSLVHWQTKVRLQVLPLGWCSLCFVVGKHRILLFTPHLLSRLKGTAGQELAKQQPFARSASTAAEMVKRRQALAELEMVPCTFHPLLDPHSLTLVAAKVSTKPCATSQLVIGT